jgi:UDP-glucose 4-epimerase
LNAAAWEGGRALVTGGAGFIGSHLVDRLLAKGYEVTCVDNFVLGRREHLASAQENPAFSLRDLDLLDLSQLDGLFASEGFDTVFHLAANSDIREGTRSTKRDLELTFMTTFNVLECMRRHGVPQLLFTSSPAVFGQHEEPLEEDSVARPESLYGASKLASEAFIAAFSGLYEIQVWLCRLSNIVGERSTHGILFDFLNKLDSDPEELEVLGDGTQSKPYMYVHDVIDAFFFILEHSNERLNVFNIGPRDGTSVADIAELVLAAYGGAQEISYTGGPHGWKGDVPLYRYCPSHLESLGWSIPSTSTQAVQTAIKRMIETR